MSSWAQQQSLQSHTPSHLQELQGTEDNIDIEPQGPMPGIDDQFDEAASHASFMDALKDWRKGPADSSSSGTSSDAAPQKASAGAGTKSSGGTNTGGSMSGIRTEHSLLDGAGYNEAAAAKSFQDALKSWRTGDDAAPAAPAQKMWCADVAVTKEVASFETQTTASPAKARVSSDSIEFKSGSKLSYMEKLMLRRKRLAEANGTAIATPAPTTTTTTAPRARSAAADTEDLLSDSDSESSEYESEIGLCLDTSAYDDTSYSNNAAAAGSDHKVTCSVMELDGSDDGTEGVTQCTVEEPEDDIAVIEVSDDDTASVSTVTPIPGQRPGTSQYRVSISPEHDGAGGETQIIEIEEWDGQAAQPMAVTRDSWVNNSVQVESPKKAHTVDTDSDYDLFMGVPAEVAAEATKAVSAASAAAMASFMDDGGEGQAVGDSDELDTTGVGMDAGLRSDALSMLIDIDREHEMEMGTPHRKIITPGMMHDFEEMEKIAKNASNN